MTANLCRLDAEGGVVLTDPAVRALAERLVASHLAEGAWLEWEDIPELAERTFMALAEEVDRIAAQMWRTLKAHDQQSGIDSAYLLEVAQVGREIGREADRG